MSDPVIAQKAPYPVNVEEGKTYYYCACGKSAKQPFCDGSHQGSDFMPTQYTASKTGAVYFCGCRRGANMPLCDGTHKNI